MPERGACSLDLNWLGWDGSRPTGLACGKPAVSALTLGCFCEHIDTVRICAECGADVQSAGAARQITCKRCWGDKFAGPGHACWMRVTIDWDSGGQTLVQAADQGGKFDFSGGARA